MKLYTTDELKQMPTDALDRLLAEELDKKELNREYILTISGILEAREAGMPIPDDDRIREAWARYQAYEHISETTATKKPRRWFAGVAAAAAVLVFLVIGTPAPVEAETVGEILVRWGHELIEFFNPRTDAPRVYEFKTEHAGLQLLHDTAVETGFEDPPVPKWVPEGFELVEIETFTFGQRLKVNATLSDGEEYILLSVRENGNTASECMMDDNGVPREFNRLEGYVYTNEGQWTAVGRGDGLELVIIANSEEVLYRIMNSVYTG